MVKTHLFGLLVALLLGCSATLESPPAGQYSRSTDIRDTSRRMYPVRLGSIRSGMLPGTAIGGEYDAFGAPRGNAWIAPEEISPEQQARWQQILVEGLSKAGCQAVSIASEFRIPSGLNEPSLHATLRSLQSRLQQAAAGPTASASVLIEWDLLDPASGESIHRGSTLGECAASDSVANAQAEAFREAARKFLLQPQTASAMRNGVSAAPASAALPAGAPVEIPRIASAAQSSAETLLDRGARAVFSIRNPAGHGSGFFIRKDGLALSSAHVVAGRRYWDALLSDGRMIRMHVLRENAGLDLALLQAAEGEFEALPLGDSGALRAGEELWAIGTPLSLNLSQSVSRGIVSALRAEASRTLIQTDAALNPGSSGGPVLNRAGEVVGVANLKIRAEAVEGIGFCTSINDARAGLLLVVR